MNKAQLDQIIDNKEDFCKWSPETRRSLRELADQYDSEVPIEQLTGRPKMVNTAEVIETCLQAFNLSPGTVRSYRGTWVTFAKYHPILPTEPQPIEAYLKRYSNRRTAADVYTKLGILYKFAADRYGITNTMERIRRPRFKQIERRSLKLQEVKAVVDACDNDFVLALIHLWLGHGLRREEALRLNIGDIGEDTMFVSGKTRDEFMPILPETRELLLRLANGRSGDQPIFMSQFKQRLSVRMAHYIAKETLERSGITGKGIAAHILRHSFSTLAQEAGMDFAACQRLMRHSKKTMTEHYTHFSSSYLKQQLEKYSPIHLIDENNEANCNKLHIGFSPVGIGLISQQVPSAELQPEPYSPPIQPPTPA